MGDPGAAITAESTSRVALIANMVNSPVFPLHQRLARRRNRWRFSRLPLTMCTLAPFRISRPVSPTGTNRPGGGPDARCSRGPPSARRTPRASSPLRRPSWTRRSDRQQVLDLGEHPLLNHLANLLIARLGWVLGAILCARSQRELDDLVPEVLRIADPGRFLDLRELLVDKLAVE
jgi:hypothetical protein